MQQEVVEEPRSTERLTLAEIEGEHITTNEHITPAELPADARDRRSLPATVLRASALIAVVCMCLGSWAALIAAVMWLL
jgi:hypothetical protein